jgi:hypothetical protein
VKRDEAAELAGRILWVEELHRLAQNLAKEVATWEPLDTSSGKSLDEQKRRGNVLWANAYESGLVLFRLCGMGFFDEMSRIKNHICQQRSELRTCLEKFEVPVYYFFQTTPYYPARNYQSYDVFFVNMFEGFCRLWAESFEDQRLLDRGTDLLERAKFYIRLLNDASYKLHPRPPVSPS